MKTPSPCPGKKSWPELVGGRGERAVTVIERENQFVTAILVPEGLYVTEDFWCDRVRVFVNDKNIVMRVPTIG